MAERAKRTSQREEGDNDTKPQKRLREVEACEEESDSESEESGGSEEESEEEEEECNISIPPCTKDGDRIQFGLCSFPALQDNVLGVEAFRNCVKDEVAFKQLKKLAEQLAAYSAEEKQYAGKRSDRTLHECVAKPSTKLLVQDMLNHTLGYTYFVRKSDEPRNLLEKVALEIFDFHLERNKGEAPQHVDPTTSGAEFWAGCCEDLEKDTVGMHFDKDYNLEEASGGRINSNPLLGTITYLTSAGAATVVVGERDKFIKVRAGESTTTKAVKHVAVSYPEANKHITFDGRLLHMASAKLQMPTDTANEQKEKRIVFLVNVWVNGFPTDMSRLVVNDDGAGEIEFDEVPQAEVQEEENGERNVSNRTVVDAAKTRVFAPDATNSGLIGHIDITDASKSDYTVAVGDTMEQMTSDMIVSPKTGKPELAKFEEKRTFSGKFAQFDTLAEAADGVQPAATTHPTTFVFTDKTGPSLFQVTTVVTRDDTLKDKIVDETLAAFPSTADILITHVDANEDGWLVL
jgi:hypothetical protein